MNESATAPGAPSRVQSERSRCTAPLDAAPATQHNRAGEVVVMEVRRPVPARPPAEPDVMQYCPNCGERGEWQKCKLLCANPRCSVRIILACVD